jgi:hypothetical protein
MRGEDSPQEHPQKPDASSSSGRVAFRAVEVPQVESSPEVHVPSPEVRGERDTRKAVFQTRARSRMR